MWKCKNCGEELEDHFDSCWNCAGKQGEQRTRTRKGKTPPVARKGICLSITNWLAFFGLACVAYLIYCHDSLLSIGVLLIVVLPVDIVAFLMLLIAAGRKERPWWAYFTAAVALLPAIAMIVMMFVGV